jgi:hypothetical protein
VVNVGARGWWRIGAGRPGWAALAALLALAVARPLTAQAWDDSATTQLIRRGQAARARSAPDSTLTGYRTRAHGFVFFLAQAGPDLSEPPRLIKADELDVEVYWRAPGIHKQVILGWRDGRWLPTDIHYHRDHLGIVTNNFGDRIRIGEGDEVRDVVHPLAPDGPAFYTYRLRDSLRLRGREGELLLHEIEVRPRDPSKPRVIGTLSLDAATGDLVRFRFSFTPSAYLDGSLEDISIVLENARVEERWWLPWRQEVEIRRRITWFDFPMRSIIRGRWEIGDYELNAPVPGAVLRGPPIAGLRAPRDSGAWERPLAEAVADVAEPVAQTDLDRVRQEASRIVGTGLLSGLPRARLGVPALSELVRVNRVQGLALGVGGAFLVAPGATLRPRLGFGTSDERVTGGVSLSLERPGSRLTLGGERRIADITDRPIISGVVNSILAQEGGRDHGDWVLLERLGATATRRIGRGVELELGTAYERSESVGREAAPARGSYRLNPALGVGELGIGRIALRAERARLDRRGSFELELRAEGGTGARQYLRGAAHLGTLVPAGPGGIQLLVGAGAGSAELPGYRSFAIGGWGTLPGEPFRNSGGRRMLLAHLEYRLEVPFPAIPLGAYVSTGPSVTLAPFVAAGWTGGAMPGVPWRPSPGGRVVAGVGLEWFHQLIRADLGVSLETGNVGMMVDFGRAWWGVL